jgi:dipeptidyl aminopeptidase/acylaminoacyl peptidase
MTMFAGTYDAAVAVVAISNLETFLANTAPYRRVLRATEYGDPEKDKEALRQLSPMTHVDKVQAPLLLVQGVDDPRVPVGEALQIHENLSRRGVPVELILLEGEGHGAARRSSQVMEYGHALRFFEEHLLGRKRGASD